MTEGEGRTAAIDDAAADAAVAREFAASRRYAQPAPAKTVTTFEKRKLEPNRNSENL